MFYYYKILIKKLIIVDTSLFCYFLTKKNSYCRKFNGLKLLVHVYNSNTSFQISNLKKVS